MLDCCANYVAGLVNANVVKVLLFVRARFGTRNEIRFLY